MRKRIQSESGFTLIEVLVGIVIFAIGMMALTQLQGNLSRSSAEANARTVAINIAEETIEELRTFGQIAATSDKIGGFNNIITKTYPDEERGGIVYRKNQTVANYYYHPDYDQADPAATIFQTTKPDTRIVNPDLKRVELTVTWDAVDNGLGTGSVTLVDLVSSFTTASGAKVVLNSYGDSLYAPPVDYNPGQNPDIISIQLGDNKFKESTTPLPDVVRQDELVETRFDVVTYSQGNDGATFLRREEFRAVSCDCRLRFPAPGEEGGRRPTVWEGGEYSEAEFVSKPYGESASTFQSVFCDMCCRDHHDGGTGENDVGGDADRSRYGPFRRDVDYHTEGPLVGDHKHYNRNRLGDLILAENDGDLYVEACRMVRKDGFFRIAQDLQQEGLNSFPADYLDDSSEVDVYSGYVTAAVSDFHGAINPQIYPGSRPTLTPPELMATPLIFPGTSTDPTALPTSSGSIRQQLRARGIYIDYMTDALRVKINCLEDNNGDGVLCQVPNVTTAMEIIPFYDVQLTWLARWNETPNNLPVDVTNEAIADNNSHDRGIATMQAPSGSSIVTSSVHTGNLGLTGTDPTDPWYTSDEELYELYVDVDVNNPPPPLSGIIISGNITSAVPGLKASDVEIEATGAQCDRTNTGYECNLEIGANNPRIKVYNYFRMNRILLACSPVLRVHGTEHLSSGTSASDNWTRFWFPSTSLSGADIVIRETDCSY